MILLCLAILLPGFIQSQCTNAEATPIPDSNVVTLGLLVSGLVNGNLAGPAQGICGVEVMFDHEFIGELTITLVSPNGTMITLVGPSSNTGSVTNLSTWDIDFIPCADTPMPDAGFSGVWSNDQMWQIITAYDGSYHPQAGCLEDFNTGPANGIWKLQVEDHFNNSLGNILGFTLIFCDPTGLSCEPCFPNAGTLSPSLIARCDGEELSTSEITVDYGSGGPPAADYQNEFMLVQNNLILQYGPFFTTSPPPGNYSLCRVSYSDEDSIIVNAVLESGDYVALFELINDGLICGDLTESCITYIVETPPDTVYVDATLCSGEVFTYRGQDYYSTGLFTQTGTGIGQCDSFFEIRLAPRLLDIDISMPDTLTCGDGDVQIAANVTGAPGPFIYSWTTDFGNITSAPNLPSIDVNQAGPYTVSVTDGLCSGTTSTTVLADQDFPQIFVDGGILTCSDPVVMLEPIYVPSDGIIQWAGPGGFMSNQANVGVMLPGTYVMMITNQEGCSTARPVDVDIDTATSTPVISTVGANCQAPFKTLGYSVSHPVASLQWSGPNGFMNTGSTVNVVDAGLYTLQVTFSNGCMRSSNFLFDGDFAIPDLTVPQSDTLNCNEVISMTATSSTPGVTFNWAGPNGFSAQQPTVAIDEAGLYNVSVQAPNGCSVQQAVAIIEGNDLFEFEIFTDTITCLQDSVPIQVISSEADVYNWLNYSGPEQGLSIIHVSTPGTYEVELTNSNTGCVISGSIIVPADLVVPVFGYLTDTITCSDPIVTMEIVTYEQYPVVNMYWELPDMSIVQGPILMSGQVGQHRLRGVGPNGCIGTWFIQIPRDTLPPFLLIEADTISCQDTVHITTQSLDSVIAYVWSGPGILLDLVTSIDVNLPGTYTLQATGVNGCISTHSIVVDSNYILPPFTIVHDSLRCDLPATLTASSPDPTVQFIWSNSSGTVLSLDTFLQTSLPDQYSIQAQGLNKCIAYDTITLLPVDYPMTALVSDTITCANPTTTIEATSDVIPVEQYWIDVAGDTIGNMSTLVVSNSGPYIFSVTGPNGCITNDTIDIPVDTLVPDAVIASQGEIRCQERDVMFSGILSTPGNLAYQWSTTGGNILSDPALSVISAQDTGWYYLMVTNLENGCQNTDSFHLLPNPEDITGAMINIIRPVCAGELNGAIEIGSVTGGIGPFLFQLLPGPPQVGAFFDGLGEGQHLLLITDSAGCEFDTLVEIPVTPGFEVSAGEDIEIYLGEIAMLSGTSDLPDFEIQTTSWDSLGNALCAGCTTLDVSPWKSTTYSFTMQSVTGCIRSDEVQVYVIEEAKYYLPNIFSPNGDGINDELRIYPAAGMARVLRWIIFDRWGNAVFGATDFDPSDQGIFWNGVTSTGETANPAVFPYLLEIQLINGNRELLHGDITLIR